MTQQEFHNIAMYAVKPKLSRIREKAMSNRRYYDNSVFTDGMNLLKKEISYLSEFYELNLEIEDGMVAPWMIFPRKHFDKTHSILKLKIDDKELYIDLFPRESLGKYVNKKIVLAEEYMSNHRPLYFFANKFNPLFRCKSKLTKKIFKFLIFEVLGRISDLWYKIYIKM